jgi:hypothetical protein
MNKYYRKIYQTPQTRLPLILWAIILFVANPILTLMSFYYPKLKYVYIPIGIDSLTLSIGDYLILWFVFSIPLILLVLLSLYKYPGQVSLLVFNRIRPFWSIFWTLFALVFIIWIVGAWIEPTSKYKMLDKFHAGLSALFTLYLRSSIVSSTIFQKSSRAA